MVRTLMLVAGVFVLCACRKNYTCECSMNGEKTVYPIENKTKFKASKICNDYATEMMLNSDGAPGSCKFIEP